MLEKSDSAPKTKDGFPAFPPQIPDNEWRELVSPTTLREGKALAEAAKNVSWETPFLRGIVTEGARRFLVEFDLRSRTIPRAKCSCELGSARRICKHALAIYFSYFAPLLKAAEAARRAAVPAKVAAREAVKFAGATVPSTRNFVGASAKNSIGTASSVGAASSVGGVSAPNALTGTKSIGAPANFVGTRANFSLSPGPQNGARVAKFSAPSESAGRSRPELDGGAEWLSIVLPSRENPHYEALRDLLKISDFVLDARSRRWFLRGEHKMLNFLATYREFLEKECRVRTTHAFLRVLRRIKTAQIRVKIEEHGEGGNGDFDFSAQLETHGVSEAEIASALACGRRYVRRGNGKIVLLPEKKLQKIAAMRERLGRGGEISGTENVFRRRFSRAELPAADATLGELGIAYEAPRTWRERSAALRDLTHLARPPVPEALFSRLRSYQQIGAAWLWFLHKNRLGGLLADEMGLGKTVEAIAYLAAVFADDEARGSAENSRGNERGADADDCCRGENLRALVVVPAGLIENWRRELARFAPEIPVRVHHGARRATDASAFSRGIVLTSYATLAIDLVLFRSREWHTIVADEAQQIKNRRSRNARSLKDIFSRTRFVLTGTPIENSTDDLRSIFEFLMPGFLPPLPRDAGAQQRSRADENLKNLAAPYILRRTKSAVAPELPPRIEQIVWCRFGDAQSSLYDAWKTRSREEIFKMEMAGASDAKLRVAAFSQLLRLRQICTEPRVLSADFPEEESTKLRAFRELLDEARAGGHRMLVFSQFVSVLDFLAEALADDGVAFCRIDGSTRDRARECDRFNASPEIPVFLISLKAGGLGLNITGADTVVHYDPWWNPAAEAQATDRAHRIGQQRTVTAIKLVVADSVEERVLALQREKKHLLSALFEASDAANAKISLAEIKELFR